MVIDAETVPKRVAIIVGRIEINYTKTTTMIKSTLCIFFYFFALLCNAQDYGTLNALSGRKDFDRLARQREMELRVIEEQNRVLESRIQMQDRQKEQRNSDAQQCAYNVLQAYSTIAEHKCIYGGTHRVYIVGQGVCQETTASIEDKKVVSVGNATRVSVKWSSSVNNEQAKINVQIGNDSVWLDVYFIYE